MKKTGSSVHQTVQPDRALWAIYRYDAIHGPIIEIKYPNCQPILTIQTVHNYNPNRDIMIHIIKELNERHPIKVSDIHIKRIDEIVPWLVPFLTVVSVPRSE